jgi:hypothetical protein
LEEDSGIDVEVTTGLEEDSGIDVGVTTGLEEDSGIDLDQVATGLEEME